jgi:hypothetical protein
MNMTVLWDVALCSLIEIDVSEVLTASIIRVKWNCLLLETDLETICIILQAQHYIKE